MNCDRLTDPRIPSPSKSLISWITYTLSHVGQKPGYSYCILSAPLARSLQDKTNPHPTSQLYSIHCKIRARCCTPVAQRSVRGHPHTGQCLRWQRIRSWFRETSKPLQFPYLPRILINGSCWFKYPGVGASPSTWKADIIALRLPEVTRPSTVTPIDAGLVE